MKCLYSFILLICLFSSCISTSDLIIANPLGKGQNSIDVRMNSQFVFAPDSNSTAGALNMPIVANTALEYSRGITDKGDIGITVSVFNYGLNLHWKQNLVLTDRYAMSLRPSVGYNGIFKDQLGLDLLNTIQLSKNKLVLLNASLYANGFTQDAPELRFLSESATIGFSFGNKHRFKIGLTAANFIQTWASTDGLPIYAGANMAYQLSW